MAIPDRLTLTLVRIEELLAILVPDDFGADAELAQRVFDDLQYLHGELKAGRRTAPFPIELLRPLQIAALREGHLTSPPFNEKRDRSVDFLRLLWATRWPLLPWQAEPARYGTGLIDEDALRELYGELRDELAAGQADRVIARSAPALRDASASLAEDENFQLRVTQRLFARIMDASDYRVEAAAPRQVRAKVMFDGCRVRLLDPDDDRHALGLWPIGRPPRLHPVGCQFGRVDGAWTVVGFD